jgi:ABC-type dipeptide/oligopeptide/nickel transport system permease component
MTIFLVRRAATTVVVFLVITVIIFSLVHAAPGDPVAMLIPPGDLNAGSVEFIARKRQELGLDQPLPLQYLSWLGDALRGDFGYSVAGQRPVSELIGERIIPTVELMSLSLLAGILIALPLGVVAAVYHNRFADYVATFISLASVSIPSFFVGIVAIYVFALKFGLLPSAGMSNPTDGSPLDLLRHLVLPVAILGLSTAGTLARYVRSSMLTELQSDYVRTALAKGVPMRRMLFRHALRNALIPIITVIALFLPGLLGGAVVIEQVFAWPGMGQLAVTAVSRQDYAVIIAFALLVSVLVLVSNLLADVLYAIVDPRVVLK